MTVLPTTHSNSGTPTPTRLPEPGTLYPEPLHLFDPADYPDYEFHAAGVRRVVPVRRGRFAGWTGEMRPYKEKGRPFFNLTRSDGQRRRISLDQILKATGLRAQGADPDEIDVWGEDETFPRFSIEGFMDYVVNDLGHVFRWYSPERGTYTKLREVVPSPVTGKPGRTPGGYQLIDNEGVKKFVLFPKLLDLAGRTLSDVAAAQQLKQNLDRL